MKTNKPSRNYAYDDHSSIPFKLVHLIPGDDQETAHRHNFFQIFFFTQTGGRHLIDFEEQDCLANQVHVVNPGNIHRLTRNNNTKGYVLLFSRAYFDAEQPDNSLFLYRNDFEKFIALDNDATANCLAQIALMEKEISQGGEYSNSVIRAALRLFIITIQRNIEFVKTASSDASNLVQAFEYAIERNFTEEHLLEYYIQALNTSSDKLNEACKAVRGKTASALINDRLMVEAKRLLFYSNQSVKEIAFGLGYQDSSYFNRIFKSKTGSTQRPLELRYEKSTVTKGNSAIFEDIVCPS